MVIYTKVLIDGTEFSNNNTIDVTNNISDFNSASSFTLTADNIEGINKNVFTTGDSIVIYADKDITPPTTKIFSGKIEDLQYSGKETRETITVSGRDLTFRLQDSTIEPSVYNDMEISLIAIDIITNYVHNITTTSVTSTGVTLSHIEFRHISAFDALKQLADICGFMFWVDVDGDLHFVRKQSASSGLTLNNTNIISSTITENSHELVNEIWVYGSRQLSAYENIFTANGGSVFSLDYSPHNTSLFIAGSTVSKLGGIYQLMSDNPSGVEYLVDYTGKRIITPSGSMCGNNIPTSGDAVVVKYDRSTPIAKYGIDRNSINAYEWHPKVIVDKNINDPRMASDMVKNELQNAFPIKSGTVNISGIMQLVSGQTIIVDLPNENIVNLTFDVISTKFNFNPTTLYNEQVMTITVNKKVKDILDTVKQMILDIKKIRADETQTSDLITRLEVSTGSFGVQAQNYKVGLNTIGNGFILGHAVNGILGSPAIAINGSQVVLGDNRSMTIKYINNYGDTFKENFKTVRYSGTTVTGDWNKSLGRLALSSGTDQTDPLIAVGQTSKIFQDENRNISWVKVNSTETKFGNDSILYYISKNGTEWNPVNKNVKTDFPAGSVLYEQTVLAGNGANQTYIENLEVSYGQ